MNVESRIERQGFNLQTIQTNNRVFLNKLFQQIQMLNWSNTPILSVTEENSICISRLCSYVNLDILEFHKYLPNYIFKTYVTLKICYRFHKPFFSSSSIPFLLTIRSLMSSLITFKFPVQISYRSSKSTFSIRTNYFTRLLDFIASEESCKAMPECQYCTWNIADYCRLYSDCTDASTVYVQYMTTYTKGL